MADKTPPKAPQEKRGGWLSRFAPGVRKIVSRRDTPDNLWVKDPDTGEMLYRSDLEAALWVTPSGRHMRIDAPTRLKATFDGGVYETIETPDVPEDPLKFSDGKSYKDRLNAARKAAGRKDTMAIGFGDLDGTPAVVIVQDFTFMGGSLGMAAGEAFIAGARAAIDRQSPFVAFTAAGGARLQAEKIRRAVEALGIPHDLPKPGSPISVSIGIATIRPSVEHDPLSLVIKADEGLYLAKHSGRNQVAQAGENG